MSFLYILIDRRSNAHIVLVLAMACNALSYAALNVVFSVYMQSDNNKTHCCRRSSIKIFFPPSNFPVAKRESYSVTLYAAGPFYCDPDLPT